MLLEDVSLADPGRDAGGGRRPDPAETHALVYLIPRFLDPTAGEVRIDGKNIRWVTHESLRAQVALVTAGRPDVHRHGGEQHRLRRPGLHPAADHRGGEAGPRPPVHPAAALRLRDADRRRRARACGRASSSASPWPGRSSATRRCSSSRSRPSRSTRTPRPCSTTRSPGSGTGGRSSSWPTGCRRCKSADRGVRAARTAGSRRPAATTS